MASRAGWPVVTTSAPAPAAAASRTLARLGSTAPRRSIWITVVSSFPLLLLAFTAAYVGAASIGQLFATVHRNVSPIWPATGLSIAVLFAGGPRFWPGIVVGTFAVTLPTGIPPAVCAAMAIGNTLEALAGAWLLRTLSRVERSIQRVRELPGLAATVTVPPMISAFVGALSLTLSGLVAWHAMPTVYATWWRGDVLGALVVTPLLLEFRPGPPLRWTRKLTIEASLLALGLVAVCLVVFVTTNLFRVRPTAYLVFPLLTWAAWRFGPRGATAATLLVAIFAVGGTAGGHGPFAGEWWENSVANLQLFLVVASATALLFGVATADRRRTEVAMSESEARRAALLRAMPDLMLRVGADGVIRDCEASQELHTLPSPRPWIGRALDEWLPDVTFEFRAHLDAALRTGALQTFAFVHPVLGASRWEQSEAGTPPLDDPRLGYLPARHFEMRLVPSTADEAVAILRDVTERVLGEEQRRTLERQFQEAQKLESLGVLAGGIAHDFNNLLTTVLGNASLVRYELPDDSHVQPCLEQIEASSRRAADLCRQLLAYAGKGRFLVEQLDLSVLVRDTAELLQLSISKAAVLRFDLAPSLPAVQADATQVRQVLMNLVMNASDAIGSREGTIHLRTHALSYRDGLLPGLVVPTRPSEGLYAAVDVVDDGCGIPPELRTRMFEPFVTTKFTGRGLGLSAVLGIVRAHGGALHVESEVGKGSRFTLLLPAVSAQARRDETSSVASDEWRGTGLVLVIDDEQNVRAVSRQLLESLGFDVLVVESGAAGLEVFRERQADIRVVLLDILMPGLDGHAVLHEIRAIDPAACIVLMSGFTELAARLGGTNPAPVFLQKPFGRDQLCSALRNALG